MHKYPIQGGGGVINFTPHPLSPSYCINGYQRTFRESTKILGGGLVTYHVQASHPGWGGGVINFTPHPLSPSYCINGYQRTFREGTKILGGWGEWRLTMYKHPIQGGGGGNNSLEQETLLHILSHRPIV